MVFDHFIIVIHAVHPVHQELRCDLEECHFETGKFFKDAAENHGDERRHAIEWPAENMHGEKVSLTVDQRAGVAQGARVAEKRNVELLCGFVEGKKDRIVHLFVFGVTDQVGGLGSQLCDAAPKLIGHLLRAAGGHHRYREEFVAVTGHQLMHPVVIAAAN